MRTACVTNPLFKFSFEAADKRQASLHAVRRLEAGDDPVVCKEERQETDAAQEDEQKVISESGREAARVPAECPQNKNCQDQGRQGDPHDPHKNPAKFRQFNRFEIVEKHAGLGLERLPVAAFRVEDQSPSELFYFHGYRLSVLSARTASPAAIPDFCLQLYRGFAQ